MPDLSSYLNVYNTALVILQQKGYTLRHDREKDTWHADKDGWEFLADNPIELLGLLSIYDNHAPKEKGGNWWKINKPDLLAELDPE
jgi:hypothetical protein